MLWIPSTNIGRGELENPKTHITSEHGICRLNALSCGFYAGFRYLKDCGKFLVTVDRLRQLSENEPAVTASVFVQFHTGLTRRAAASEEIQNDGVRVVTGRREQAVVDRQKALRDGKRGAGNQLAH